MIRAELGKEIVIRTENDIGVLWEVAKTLSEKGIDVLAASAWVEGKDGVIHLVTDDNLRAVDALRKRKFSPREAKVVTAEAAHKPGMLMKMAEILMEEAIDIHHLYASAPGAQGRCLVVFACSDNDRAVVALNKDVHAAVRVP